MDNRICRHKIISYTINLASRTCITRGDIDFNHDWLVIEIQGAPELTGMTVAVIVFTDGEHHLTQTWTVRPGNEYVEYIDVHCEAHSPPIRVAYRVIAEVKDYQKAA